MINNRNKRGLTLIELIIALIVTSIIVTAVVTLAHALDTANEFTEDSCKTQVQIRFATLRISDLIRHCKLVCYASTDEIAVWSSDSNNNGKINLSELTYIETGAAHDHLQLYTFTDSAEISLSLIDALSTNWWSTYGSLNDPTPLIPQCSEVEFGFLPDLPPQSDFVTISFKVVENGVNRQCQINTTLRARAENLLDGSGNIVSDDD